MKSIIEVSDYIIFRCKSEGQNDLSTLKHQKLLYYVQAWHLAFYGEKAFDSDFEAWIHGPVCKEIYEIYKDSKGLYSEMFIEDIKNEKIIDSIGTELKIHIDTILDSYGKFTATQLELMTHDERPWIEARKGYNSNQRCSVEIDNEVMKKYYSARLAN